MRGRALVAVALLLGACARAAPEAQYGRVVGVVTDCAGTPLAGRAFELVPIETVATPPHDGVAWSSGEQGQVGSRPLPFGEYVIHFPADERFAESRYPVRIDRPADPDDPMVGVMVYPKLAPAGEDGC